MATAKTNRMDSSNIELQDTKRPPKPTVSPSHLSVPGNSKEDAERVLSRCSSLPDGIDAPVSVQLRNSSPRSRRKAQMQRNSVAITSSDYYNQRRPQISQLAVVQQAHTPLRSVTSPLHPITENDAGDNYRSKRSSMVADLHDLNGLQITDSRLFRYRSNPSLEPAPTSRPTTPQVSNPNVGRLKRQSSAASSMTSINRADSFLSLHDGTSTPPTGTLQSGVHPLSIMRMSSQAVQLTASVESQFLPLYLNAETGLVYVFEDGYYIPLTQDSMKALQDMANFSKPPAPDRRKAPVFDQPRPRPSPQKSQPTESRVMTAPSDYFCLVQILLLLYAVCLNIPVLLLCSTPAFICSLQVRKANRNGNYELAKRRSEYVMCFTILGVIFHVFSMLAIIATFLLLHFLGGYFTLP